MIRITRLVATMIVVSSVVALCVGQDSPNRVAPKEDSPKEVAPKEVAPKKVAPKKVAPKKVAPVKKRNVKTAFSLEQQEPDVLQFVAENHSELSPLLKALKKHSPQNYTRAVRDLHRVQQRLSSMRERDSQRHELEVKIWQTKSRAQLLAANLAANLPVSKSDPRRDQLEKLVGQHLRFRSQLLKRDRRRQQDRIKKLNEQIDKLSNADTLDREVEMLLRAVPRNGKPPTGKAKASATGKNSKTIRNGTENR